PSPQSASLSTLSSGTGALGDTTNGGSRFFGQRLAFLWEWLEGLRQCAEALWDLFVVIALSLWRVLSLQFCPRRREYLVHAQGIAAIARLALERERDDDRGLGLDYDSGPISYTTSLIDNTFFPPLPGFGPTPNSPAAVSPFSTHPSAGFWACLSSLWPDVDPEDYSGSAVVRLAAVLSVWADSFRQLGTLLQLSADLEPRGWAKRNLFFGARENLAVSAVEAFGDRAIPKSTPQKSSNGRLLRNSEAEGVFSRLLSWFSCLWPLWKRGEKGGVGKGTCQPGSAAGLFPYLLWWRWWPAAAAAAIPRNPGKNGVITYSSPCFFPGVGRCVDAGCGPTPSNLEDYWSYARILTAADHSTRESLDGRGSESACVLSPFEFGDIMSQPAPRPVFPPLFFSSDLFPSVFGGWLFPVTGNPSFATLPFFRVLWWPAAVAAAGGGYSSPWRLHPGGVALTARCETTSQRQRCSLHAQGGAYCSSRISSSSSSKHSSFRIEEDGRGAKLWQTAWRNGCSGGDDEDGHCFSSQLRCLDFSLSSLAGGPPPIFCVNSMKEGVSSSSLPHCQESGNRKNMPSEHKAAPVVTRRGDESDSFITRLLSKLCPGVSRLLVEPCRFCALNLRADIKPPPPSFVAPPPAFMPQCVTRTMEFLCCPGKSGEEKCSRDDSSQSSNSSSPPHKNRNRHATSGGSSSVVGPHILLPETSS
ncbi:transmembrane protein, partial [Cystoisospora suis]